MCQIIVQTLVIKSVHNFRVHILFLFANKYLHSVVKRLSKTNSSKVTHIATIPRSDLRPLVRVTRTLD